MTWAKNVARIVEMKYVSNILVRKSERMKPHGERRHRWMYNIKANLKELRVVGCGLHSS